MNTQPELDKKNAASELKTLSRSTKPEASPPASGDATEARRLSVWHDLYVDLLGSLVPGLLTVILGGTAILLALWPIHTALFPRATTSLLTVQPSTVQTSAAFSLVKDVIASVHWEIATVILVSAYVIGAVFFRQDPK